MTGRSTTFTQMRGYFISVLLFSSFTIQARDIFVAVRVSEDWWKWWRCGRLKVHGELFNYQKIDWS